MNDRYQIEIYSAGNIDNSPENRYRLQRDAVRYAKLLKLRLRVLVNRDPQQPVMRIKIYDAFRDRIVWDSGEIANSATKQILQS